MAAILVLMGHWGTSSFEQKFQWVFWLVTAAVFFDTIDGSVARLLRVQSSMGAQLDNLCDATTFGLAVGFAIIVFLERVLSPEWGPISYILGVIWLLAVIVRLARFQVDQEDSDPAQAHMYFRGLCSPMAALFAVSLMQLALRFPAIQTIAPVILLAAAGLMISNFPFADLPKHYLGRRRPVWEVGPFVIAAPFISISGSVALFITYFILLSLGSPTKGRVVLPKRPSS